MWDCSRLELSRAGWVGWRVLRKKWLHNQPWSPGWSGEEERPRERQKAGGWWANDTREPACLVCEG